MATGCRPTRQSRARMQRLNRKRAARYGQSLSFAQIVAASPKAWVPAPQHEEARVFKAAETALRKEGLL
jgi:hypothetical protein